MGARRPNPARGVSGLPFCVLKRGKTMKQKKQDILSLSWPIFVELLLQMLVGNADQIMVGWRDPNGVGAIGNAN